MDKIRKAVEDLEPGQRQVLDIGESVILVYRESGNYRVVYASPMMAVFREDPGSILCGCKLQGTSHGHAEYTVASIDTAMEKLAYINDCHRHRKLPEGFERVG